jgi:hypothetical protein
MIGNEWRRITANSSGSVPVYIGLICLLLVAAGLVVAFVPSVRLGQQSLSATGSKPGVVADAAVADAEQRAREQRAREQRELVQKESWDSIGPHHWRVVGWVLECTNIKAVPSLPPYLRSFFDPLQASQKPLEKDIAAPARLPHHHEMALVQISRAIADHRLTLSTKVNSTYHAAQIATIGTVMLGFITTLVVSLNSTAFGQGQGRLQQWMRFMAIVLTAMGTMLSAMIAFYGPLDEWNDTKRTLAALTSLHNVIGLETWKLDCLEFEGSDLKQLKAGSETNKLVMQRFEEWTKRYYELQTAAGSVQTEKPAAVARPPADPPKPPAPAGSKSGTE